MGKNIYIIADIEGSSECVSRTSAKLLGRGWPEACLGMSLDVRAVTAALIHAGASRIVVQDFHRTAYNLFPALMPDRVELIQGYREGPVPGMGNPKGFDAVMMIGMHAPSGTAGFLAHTLTSRVRRLTVNGHPVSEAQLFAAALAGYGLSPVFLSGCPVACSHTRRFIPGTACFPIDKSEPRFNPVRWRSDLAHAAVESMSHVLPRPYNPQGPFKARVTLSGGVNAARVVAGRWKDCTCKGADLVITVPDFAALFAKLSRMIYLTPLIQRLLPLGLPLYHVVGRAGLIWAGKQVSPGRRSNRC